MPSLNRFRNISEEANFEAATEQRMRIVFCVGLHFKLLHCTQAHLCAAEERPLYEGLYSVKPRRVHAELQSC